MTEELSWYCPACNGAITGPDEETVFHLAKEHIKDHEMAAVRRALASMGFIWSSRVSSSTAPIQYSSEELTDDDRKFLADLKVVY